MQVRASDGARFFFQAVSLSAWFSPDQSNESRAGDFWAKKQVAFLKHLCYIGYNMWISCGFVRKKTAGEVPAGKKR